MRWGQFEGEFVIGEGAGGVGNFGGWGGRGNLREKESRGVWCSV